MKKGGERKGVPLSTTLCTFMLENWDNAVPPTLYDGSVSLTNILGPIVNQLFPVCVTFVISLTQQRLPSNFSLDFNPQALIPQGTVSPSGDDQNCQNAVITDEFFS